MLLQNQFLNSQISTHSIIYRLRGQLSKLILGCSICLLLCATANAAQLNNGVVKLELGESAEGIPVIVSGSWVQSGESFLTDDGSIREMQSWIPAELVKADSPPSGWTIKQGRTFLHAEASRELVNGLKMTWVVDLLKQCSLFQLSVRISNQGMDDQNIDWFPSWVDLRANS